MEKRADSHTPRTVPSRSWHLSTWPTCHNQQPDMDASPRATARRDPCSSTRRPPALVSGLKHPDPRPGAEPSLTRMQLSATPFVSPSSLFLCSGQNLDPSAQPAQPCRLGLCPPVRLPPSHLLLPPSPPTLPHWPSVPKTRGAHSCPRAFACALPLPAMLVPRFSPGCLLRKVFPRPLTQPEVTMAPCSSLWCGSQVQLSCSLLC